MADRGVSLGETIRLRRAELGWTQEELANRIAEAGEVGFRQSGVSRLENGRVALPRRDRLERIAAVLRLPVCELLARSGWAGADTALAAPRPAATTDTAARVATAPTPRAEGRQQAPAEGHARRPTSQMGELIEQAHELRAWLADVLRRSAETFARANRSASPAPTRTPPRGAPDRD